MPGLVMIGPVVWAVGEFYTQTHTHTHTHTRTLLLYIYRCMKNLHALDVDDLKIHFRARKGTILNYLQKVQKVDESIIEVYYQGDESVEERKLAEITSQIGYNDSIRDELTLIER